MTAGDRIAMPSTSPASRIFALGFILFVTSQAAALPAASATNRPKPAHQSPKDFDFLHGSWIVHNRRLTKRLAGSTNWIAFDARDEFHALPGGIGTQEHYVTNYWRSFEAIGLNIHDPQTQRWTLYWVDNQNEPIVLQPPVSGRFSGNVGTFEGPDTFNGKPILVRQIWKSVDANDAYWEQAFSGDGGKSWETNWTMDFVRLQTLSDRTTAPRTLREND
jgi:hypothetical protein